MHCNITIRGAVDAFPMECDDEREGDQNNGRRFVVQAEDDIVGVDRFEIDQILDKAEGFQIFFQ